MGGQTAFGGQFLPWQQAPFVDFFADKIVQLLVQWHMGCIVEKNGQHGHSPFGYINSRKNGDRDEASFFEHNQKRKKSQARQNWLLIRRWKNIIIRTIQDGLEHAEKEQRI